MRFGTLAIAVIAGIATTCGAWRALANDAEPLTIAYPVWVGYGPLFLALEKGFFAAEGLNVQLTEVEEGDWEGLRDGQFDAISTTLDEVAAWFDPDRRPVCVLALDESRGGDGVIAVNEVETISDLRGRAVALQDQSLSQFFLTTLLHEAGLSVADIEPVNLAAPDAVEAFLLGQVDAVVTWEPWLTEAAEGGRLLESSSSRPGLIVDCMVTTTAVFERRKSDFQALARGWAAAVDHYENHPEESLEIMARHVGGWLQDPAAFAESLEGVRFYGRDENKAYFGTAQDPGPVHETAKKAIAVWSDLGAIETPVRPADIVGHGIWD